MRKPLTKPMPYPPLKLPAESEIGVLSKGVQNIPHLSRLLGYPVLLKSGTGFVRPVSAIAGWGHKATATVARRYALQHKLPYLALEDGFLRSIGLGRDSPPQSLVLDDVGIYYDASVPSRLEQLIGQALTVEQQHRAEALIELWRNAGVSKYNHLRDFAGDLPNDYVLLVDQTYDDASVTLGGANAESFTAMLEAALRLYPKATLLLKSHPEASAGQKRGYFETSRYAKHPRIQILSEAVHPVRLIREAQAIFTVTSQLGFEGLLWQKPVHTYGMPFYAGWGLTRDALPASPRRRTVTLEQLAHAALIDYARYLHPDNTQRCEVENLVVWAQQQRAQRNKFSERVYGLGFSLNKQISLRKFLAGSELVFVDSLERLDAGSTVAVWGSTPVLRQDLAVLRLEDGFLRSAGLGADLVRPLSYVSDATGIYYDASQPSELEQLLQQQRFDASLLARAAALRQRIVAAGISKYNLPGEAWVRPPHASRVILVPGQVETDASIVHGAPQIKRNIDLLRAVREANPNAYLIYKPHPDVVAKLRKSGAQEHQAPLFCDEVVTGVSLNQLLSQSDEVHVMTSLTGFEALLRGCTVVTYGLPFYAGWGLTTDHCLIPRRTARPTLNELVAAALILYPRYVLPKQAGFASPEAVLDHLERLASQVKPFQRVRALVRRFVARLTTTKR